MAMSDLATRVASSASRRPFASRAAVKPSIDANAILSRRISTLGDPAATTLATAISRPGIAGTAYDTAWLAAVPEHHGGTSRFPTALQWLVEHQHADGSWGGHVRYEHDRIISTLAALAPIAEFGRRATDYDAVVNGTRYLWQRSHLLRTEPLELVATELLLPTLAERARQVGIPVPPTMNVYAAQRAEKLRLIPPDALYSRHTTAAHSLEFLGDDADLDRLRHVQGDNGGVGNSPAATAYFFSRTNDPRALTYLLECREQAGGTMVPVLSPCESFELLWSAYHLFLAGVPAERVLTPGERSLLARKVRSGGVSLSETFPISDADDTAVALILLSDLDGPQNAEALQPFALPDGHFASFPYERRPSIGVNLHVLQALTRSSEYPNRDVIIDCILDYVLSQQVGEMYWLDKWHVSPYYATAHALCCLRDLDPKRAQRAALSLSRARAWIRSAQNADGSWGFYGQPTAEETAYAVLALAAGTRGTFDPLDWLCCDRAIRFLRATLEADEAQAPTSFPELWIDKCLYVPSLVVQSVIEAAFIAFALRNSERFQKSA
jgi:halimadienyl-diphosphate synthase